MRTLRRFGRIVKLPSSRQIRHELRTILLPGEKSASATEKHPFEAVRTG
jgi:hypothetical protein